MPSDDLSLSLRRPPGSRYNPTFCGKLPHPSEDAAFPRQLAAAFPPHGARMATCPECEFDEIDTADYEEGDTFSCRECGKNLVLVGADDVEIADEDEEDEDLEDEDEEDEDEEDLDDEDDEDLDDEDAIDEEEDFDE